MRMNQDERRFDFHGLGAALKRAREEKGWTQAYAEKGQTQGILGSGIFYLNHRGCIERYSPLYKRR